MAHLPVRTRSLDEDPPLVVEGELVDLDALIARPTLKYPPAARPRCRCGKDGSLKSHGGLTCDQVLDIGARTEAAHRRRPYLLVGGALVAVAGVVGGVWLLVLGVVALVAMVTATVTAVSTWFATYWPALAVVAVLLLLMGGGAKCAGLHCGGCRG